MDLAKLREMLSPLIIGVGKAGTHPVMAATCAALGLPAPPDEGEKRERIQASMDAVPDAELPALAERLLTVRPPSPANRNLVQDFLWADAGYPEVPKRTRREVAHALEAVDLALDAAHFDALLDRLWILGGDGLEILFGGIDKSLRAEIDRHVHRFPGDWSADVLFDQLGAFDASDRRFALFLEGLASADVRPNESEQRIFVEEVNAPLKAAALEMRETGMEGGYPVFELVPLHAVSHGKPKNLIFASSIKPDLRFRDAIDNDIEIVSNADKVLIYNRPIGREGLRWSDLQAWWMDEQGIADANEGKGTLYRRLKASLPPTSPPQAALFTAFYKGFAASVQGLPALLPEVWLHWDPQTVRERGRDALLRSRMDFLMLLPYGVRVVIEVDGKQHYSDAEGRADTKRYAEMMRADRELRTAGYEVYRFGAAELQGDTAGEEGKSFFSALFKRHGVPV